jgi:hypothetical protein
MTALLGKASVIHNPAHNLVLLPHGRQNRTPHLPLHLLIAPRRIRHQVMQALVHALNVIRGQPCRHRLYALSFAG